MEDKTRCCKNCRYREYETDMKVYVCGDPDGEYLGEPVRDQERCPDFEAKEGKNDKDGNITGS